MPTNHFNGLTEAEAEALSLLMEECAEVIQIIGKIQRHGLDSGNPATGVVNRDALAKECADVKCSIEIVLREGIILPDDITKARRKKIKAFRDNPSRLHHIDAL
jgi:NTP pyrophosphatase (non-canonical NTP hydrolase)